MKLMAAVVILFVSNLAQASFNYECGMFMAEVMNAEKYSEIRNTVPFNRRSADLSVQERNALETTKRVLRQTADHFNDVYNKLFLPHGTKFLPELKDLFEKEEQLFRQKNQIIINELQRYLDDRGDLTFRHLDILQVIASVKNSWAMRFLQNPEDVYFNISYFFTSRIPDGTYEDGYFYSITQHNELNQPVYILNPKKAEQYSDVTYPGSKIVVPRLEMNDKLVFPGLPFTKELIEFLSSHGNFAGKIQLVLEPIGAGKRTWFSKFMPEQRLKIETYRWSKSKVKYYEVFDEDGSLNLSLSNWSNYYEDQKHLVVPALPVSWDEMKQGLFSPYDIDKRRLSLTVTPREMAEFAIAPTPFEFLTAFIEVLQY